MSEKLSFNLTFIVAAVAFLALVPSLGAGERAIYFLSLTLIWGLFAAAFDLSFGVTGLLSFGHAALLGGGAYVFSILTADYAVPWGIGLISGAAVSGLLGLLYGLISMHVGGLFFALVSLAAAELIHILVSSTLRDITGGHDGFPAVPRPMIGSTWDFYDNTTFYYLILAIVFVSVLVLAVLRSSPFGRLCQGVRLNHVRMTHIGFRIARIRSLALLVSGVFSGISGGLLASLMMFISPETLSWTTSGDVLIMTLLGGAGTLIGPLLGALVFETMRDVLSDLTVHWYGLLGLAFILCTIHLPEGLMSVRPGRLLSRLFGARRDPQGDLETILEGESKWRE